MRARIYAVGGDGILFDCLGGIVGVPGVELAALPYGSSNDFIRSFESKNTGTPAARKFGALENWRDLDMQMRGEPALVDVMDSGTNYALNFCCIGIEAETMLKINEYAQKPGRFYRPVLSILLFFFGAAALFDKESRSKWYQIEIDGESYDGKYCGINIANGRYYGGAFCANVDAVPDDGELDILMIKSAAWHTLLPIVPDYLHGKWYKHSEKFVYVRAKSIRIHSEDTITIAVDGETYRDTELRVSVLPRAVSFNRVVS